MYEGGRTMSDAKSQTTDIIQNEDLEYETYPKSVGGQQVGVPNGLKITHKPSGLIVISDCQRSQHRNRELAKEMLAAALTSKWYR